MKNKTISVRVHVTIEDIENMLYSAAQGCDYWCSNSGELGYEHNVKQVTEEGLDWIAVDAEREKGEQTHFFLNMTRIKRGLTILAKKYPHHFKDIIDENTDMITADCLVQCALFGDIIYG